MSKRILVVEDQEDNRQILRDLLSSAGYEMIEAENGEQALDAGGEAAARPDPDGHPASGHGRLRGDAPHQGRSRPAVDPDHRGDVLCAGWGRREGARGRLRRLTSPSPTARASCWRRSAST